MTKISQKQSREQSAAEVSSGENKLTYQQAADIQKYIIDKANAIVLAKRHDYSGSVDPFGNFRKSKLFGVEPWRGVLIRLTDKLSRVESVVTAGGVSKVPSESLWDTLSDAVNYVCILGGLVAEIVGLPEEPQVGRPLPLTLPAGWDNRGYP